ncbi:hypothetical protein METBIDRAFT_76113 [Metschnikowia bicuspidata var. bicuspidata NRRL YB-4993]|uniref:RAVE subunit 2/Rogdi n=1 Tax=Metschnikowia bicuspidata var. bicuspidata NRRL YB-4993 TaxID=869754 RepID=A0A1A0HGH2_9ASCO|nr:hypothetical protein METBIDRAFT_76113 [Metschnikowia bicuspidata var. bicuspidata NRRL YB-4993]OBA22977.1 hypothetical protein METBIDRAFT_76113 [Metschnikowia bicuspidata var. bicuspidata NRRL YB-4993]
MGFISSTKARRLDAELHWLVTQIITPELPQLVEALRICSNLLLYNSPVHPDKAQRIERGPSITLPISLGKLDDLKGILVRDGAYITHMSVHLKERHFNRVLHKLVLKKPYLLAQIITAKRGIDRAVALLLQAASVFDENPNTYCDPQSHGVLMAVFAELLAELQTAKNSLQLPTQPELVFPLHRTDPAFFEPLLSPHIALDLYISQAEVCIDLKDLAAVHDRPWCEIDPVSGKSYVDTIRDQMSAGKADVSGPHADEKSDRGLLGSVFSHLLLRPRHEPHDYIARCVTYNNLVVMVNKKIEVSSADPVLVSAFTKLDSVEHMVSSFLDNIRTLYQDEQ